jgi:hypothetical protein
MGRVVDSAGKPVAGVEVYQSGDGPRRTPGTTDDDGRFQVAGVPAAPALLFARKEGYRFVGRRVEPDDRPIEIAVRRVDEAPETPLRPAAAAVSRAEERAMARELMAEAQKAGGSVHDSPERREIPGLVALVDPERAIARIEDQVYRADTGLLTALALGRFEDDPRKALEVIEASGDPSAALGLFDRLGKTAPPDFRRALLERAEGWARRINDRDHGITTLARVADRWLDLRDAQRGARASGPGTGRAAWHTPVPRPLERADAGAGAG